MDHNHADLKDHIRANQSRTREKMLKLSREGKRNPVDGLEASAVAAEFLNLRKQKVKRL